MPAYQDVEKIVRQKVTRAQKSLDLQGLGLTEVPKSVFKLTGLEFLNLSGNKLASLPNEIEHLQNLSFLWLDSNHILELPSRIFNLRNLKELRLTNNRISYLNPRIENLRKLISLHLDNNDLTALAPEVRALVELTELSLDNNLLQNLPVQIGELRNLRKLWLDGNSLRQLPNSITRLENLATLSLDTNNLSDLPLEICELTNLVTLHIAENKLSKIPDEIVKLTHLEFLSLRHNQIAFLPQPITNLKKLQTLWLQGNHIVELPVGLGQVTSLQDINLEDNPLRDPPAEIAEIGTEALMEFIRERDLSSEINRRCRLVVLGEIGAGKSQLVSHLRGTGYDKSILPTEEPEVSEFSLPQIAERMASIDFNVWDLGRKTTYHTTYQICLTNKSVFILVFSAQPGINRGRITFWLDQIQAIAPNSRGLALTSYADKGKAEWHEETLIEDYKILEGHLEISNVTGLGIDAVKNHIVDIALKMPHVGIAWPKSWLKAARALQSSDDNYISPRQLLRIFKEAGVKEKHFRFLAKWMHEIGDIIFFEEKNSLNDYVILKPRWLLAQFDQVIDDKIVTKNRGVLTQSRMRNLWRTLPPGIQRHLILLMEEFDLSYRTLEDTEASLIIGSLSSEFTGYQEEWSQVGENEENKEVSIIFFLSALPAGVPARFIARMHRFSTGTHWLYGMLLHDGESHGLVIADPNDNTVELSVRGRHPHVFLAILKHGFESTLQQHYPGLKVRRAIPCPCKVDDEKRCAHNFDYEKVESLLGEKVTIECPISHRFVDVSELLLGISVASHGQILHALEDLRRERQETMSVGDEKILAEIRNNTELIQLEFTRAFRREQSKIESHCPNTFTLIPVDPSWKINPLHIKEVELQLYCQAPGHWHPTADGGKYRIKQPAEWLVNISPYLSRVIAILKYALPWIKPLIGIFDPEQYEESKHQIQLMEEFARALPESFITPDSVDYFGKARNNRMLQAQGTEFRLLRHMLEKLDPTQHWGGLQKVATVDGQFLWLCEHHKAQFGL